MHTLDNQRTDGFLFQLAQPAPHLLDQLFDLLVRFVILLRQFVLLDGFFGIHGPDNLRTIQHALAEVLLDP